MLAEISAGLGSLKAAADIIKGMNAANTQTSINEVKITLQGYVFEAREALASAQEAQSVALERIRELEQQIVQFEDWERQKDRYELKPMREGPDAPVAYALKETMQPGEAAHWICSYCYEDRKKSPLQPEQRPRRTLVFKCHRCGAEHTIQGEAEPRPTPAVRTRRPR